MKELVSIITVSYNSEDTITETILSVLNQSYDNYEYIIIDGLSTDNTINIAKSFENDFKQKKIPYYIISEKDNGIYDAMNKGIKLAKGNLIGIINSDDFYNPYTLERIVNFYSKVNYDIMFGDLRIFNNNKELIKKAKLTDSFNTRYWNHPTTFVTAKVYAEQLYACESIYDDLDFMLKARKKGYKFFVLNEILANFRLGGISNKKSLINTIKRLKLKNSIYKKYRCKGYLINNFIMEFGKFFLA